MGLAAMCPYSISATADICLLHPRSYQTDRTEVIFTVGVPAGCQCDQKGGH